MRVALPPVTTPEERRAKLMAARDRLTARGLDGDAVIAKATENLRYWREHPAEWEATS